LAHTYDTFPGPQTAEKIHIHHLKTVGRHPARHIHKAKVRAPEPFPSAEGVGRRMHHVNRPGVVDVAPAGSTYRQLTSDITTTRTAWHQPPMGENAHPEEATSAGRWHPTERISRSGEGRCQRTSHIAMTRAGVTVAA
jgi:hypothetical protein